MIIQIVSGKLNTRSKLVSRPKHSILTWSGRWVAPPDSCYLVFQLQLPSIKTNGGLVGSTLFSWVNINRVSVFDCGLHFLTR